MINLDEIGACKVISWPDLPPIEKDKIGSTCFRPGLDEAAMALAATHMLETWSGLPGCWRARVVEQDHSRSRARQPSPWLPITMVPM